MATEQTQPQVFKMKYIGGSGKELAYPLSNGLTTIAPDQIITLTNYQDFVRLKGSADFEEIVDTPAVQDDPTGETVEEEAGDSMPDDGDDSTPAPNDTPPQDQQENQ